MSKIAKYATRHINAKSLYKSSYIGVDNLIPDKGGKRDSDYVPSSGNLKAYQESDILIGNIRPYLKKIWLANNSGGASGDVLVIRPTDENIKPKYLYYLLSSDKFFAYNVQFSKGAKMPRGSKDAIMRYKFQLPPLPVQEAIVDILDRFEAIVHDIQDGLPAEIALRQKQYEYYRDKLLTFEPLETETKAA